MGSDLVQRSKYLSKILRHQPELAGLSLDDSGWVSVEDLLSAVRWTRTDLDQVVSDNNKKRFEYDPTGTLIRASQGHSVGVDLGYAPKTPPDTLYHGTAKALYETLMREGLQKMARHHVHLSQDKDTAGIVARRRKGAWILFAVDAKRMYSEGLFFYQSTNGVWLTDNVPPSFLSLV